VHDVTSNMTDVPHIQWTVQNPIQTPNCHIWQAWLKNKKQQHRWFASGINTLHLWTLIQLEDWSTELGVTAFWTQSFLVISPLKVVSFGFFFGFFLFFFKVEISFLLEKQPKAKSTKTKEMYNKGIRSFRKRWIGNAVL